MKPSPRRRSALVLVAFTAACASSETVAPDDAGAPIVEASSSDVTDAKPRPDAAPTCADGAMNGTETDVDCGGACAKCDDGKTCKAGADCREGACLLGHCGQTAWFSESTGANVPLPADQTWVSSPGLELALTLYDTATIHVRFTGTSRFGGVAGGICHIGQRIVVDGKPTGHPTWGNAILVQRGDLRSHETFDSELTITLPKGAHQIAGQANNGSSLCYLDGDGGQRYDRSRIAATAFDPATAWSAESTSATGSLVAGAGWMAIPGVAISAKLATPSHVQLSLSGTQLSQGTSVAHCGYRFVIDGTPLGNPTHGQAIVVGDIGSGWWAPVVLSYGVDLAAGPHTISAEATNSAATGGTCNLGEGNNDYAKVRLFASATAQGGPNVSVESSGASNVLGTGSVWTPVSGLSAPITLASDTNVLLELSATQRNVTGSGHCAWRFVIDGTPLGQTDHGQALNVGDGTYTWWNAAALLWGQSLKAGAHTIGVDVRNSSSSGDCGTNADPEAYGRARLLVRVP